MKMLSNCQNLAKLLYHLPRIAEKFKYITYCLNPNQNRTCIRVLGMTTLHHVVINFDKQNDTNIKEFTSRFR